MFFLRCWLGSCGVPVFVSWERPFTFQRHIGILRPNGTKVRGEYLYHFLCSPHGAVAMQEKAEGLVKDYYYSCNLSKHVELPAAARGSRPFRLMRLAEYNLERALLSRRVGDATNLGCPAHYS